MNFVIFLFIFLIEFVISIENNKTIINNKLIKNSQLKGVTNCAKHTSGSCGKNCEKC